MLHALLKCEKFKDFFVDNKNKTEEQLLDIVSLSYKNNFLKIIFFMLFKVCCKMFKSKLTKLFKKNYFWLQIRKGGLVPYMSEGDVVKKDQKNVCDSEVCFC